MVSAAQKEGDFAGARVVSHAFSYLIQCNSHFYQADMYFLHCTLLRCSCLKDNNCYFAGSRVVSHAFSYLIQYNSHFYQADMYFLHCTLLRCSCLKDNNCCKSECVCALVII